MPNAFKNSSNLEKKISIVSKTPKLYPSNEYWPELLSGGISSVNMCLIFYETDLLFQENYQITDIINILRSLITGLCILHTLAILKIYSLHKNQLSIGSLIKLILLNPFKYKKLIVEIFIAMVHTPPGISATIELYQMGSYTVLSYSDILFPICMLKVYFILLFLSKCCGYNTKKFNIILSIFNCENLGFFMMKTCVKESPFITIQLFFGLSLIFVEAHLRVFEKSVSRISIWDETWLGFETESTVGYGEFYPNTHIGRLVCALGAIIGIFMFSYNVTSARNLSKLSAEELKTAKVIKHTRELSKNLQPKALILIKKWWISRKTKNVKLIFSVIEEAKKFKYQRQYLNTDLSATFSDQIIESSHIINKNFINCLDIFKNTEEISEKSATMLRKNFDVTRKIISIRDKLQLKSNAESLQVASNSHLRPCSNISKMRSEALKNLFIRRSGLKSLNGSPNLSYVE
jgi:Ion channel